MSRIAHSLTAQSPEFARTGGPHFDIRSSYSGSIGSAETKHPTDGGHWIPTAATFSVERLQLGGLGEQF